MRSLIIIEVEHGDTTDGVNEALFDFGIGSRFDPQADDQWPTADDGATWPNLAGIDYEVTNYTVRVDLPECFVLDSPVWLHEDGTVCEAGPAEGATDWCDEHDRDIHRQTIEN